MLSLWPHHLPVVGMVHLRPLPGSPGWSGSMEAVLERAVADVLVLAGAGVDGLLVENYGDVPFHPGPVGPETVAALTVAVRRLQAVTEVPLGVNVLRNDARAALAVAAATGAPFIRVNVHTGTMFSDQGALTGLAHETLRTREALGAPVAILADVLVKHATPPPGTSIEEAARDCWHRGLADGLVVSGAGTGRATDPDALARVRDALPEAPLWVGSGATAASLAELSTAADGVIVGSALRRGGVAGAPVESGRAQAFMDAALDVRSRLA